MPDLRTLPGEQAQVDWGHFGTLPGTDRALMAFVLVLSFSRRIALRFYPGAAMAMFLRPFPHANLKAVWMSSWARVVLPKVSFPLRRFAV